MDGCPVPPWRPGAHPPCPPPLQNATQLEVMLGLSQEHVDARRAMEARNAADNRKLLEEFRSLLLDDGGCLDPACSLCYEQR